LSFMSSVAVPLFVSLATAAATSAMVTEPDVKYSNAAAFLQQYYKDVYTEDGEKFRATWTTDLTETFRSFPQNRLEAMDRFYGEEVIATKVLWVRPLNSANQFAVTLRFTKKDGTIGPMELYIFYLKCLDPKARLPVVTCPKDAIQIDFATSATQRPSVMQTIP